MYILLGVSKKERMFKYLKQLAWFLKYIVEFNFTKVTLKPDYDSANELKCQKVSYLPPHNNGEFI